MARWSSIILLIRNLQAIGYTTKCTKEEYTHGRMVVDMMDSTQMTKSQDMEFTLGQMVVVMKDFGRMENKMGRGNIL